MFNSSSSVIETQRFRLGAACACRTGEALLTNKLGVKIGEWKGDSLGDDQTTRCDERIGEATGVALTEAPSP